VPILGLVMIAVAAASVAAGAKPPAPREQQLDSATANGASRTPPAGLGAVVDIGIDAHSGPSGENPGGFVSYDVLINRITHLEPFPLNYSGPVTCLNVHGNTALINFLDDFPVTVELVENGDAGADGFRVGYGNAEGDCSSFPDGVFEFSYDQSLGAGRAEVFDAQPPPPPPPVIGGLAVDPKKFAASGESTPLKPATGAEIRLTLSEDATVTFKVRREQPARRGAPTPENPRTFRRDLSQGASAIPFTGTLGNFTFKPRHYTLTARARDSSKQPSERVSTGFRITE
jgi:hypothetical protein